jgi:assimilatory nitrate reductase electron transfer subunit
MAAKKIVVIGYGLAAHRLVTRLLAGDEDLEVSVYAGEADAPYDRTRLPDLVAGRRMTLAGASAELAAGTGARDSVAVPVAVPGEAALALPIPDDPRLRVRHGVRATALDRMHRLVHGSDRWVEPYDALVLATGANPVLPPIRGLRTPDGQDLLPGVHPVQTLADFRALGHAAASASRAVVIGGGATGLRVAEALHTMRSRDPWRAPLTVELVDQSPATPEITAAHSFFALRMAGVVAYQDCRVRSLEEGPDGRVAAAILADGYRLTCDLAVLACGTAPNTALAWTSGLAVARGIVVDDALRSVTDPHVHAIGDCAEHRRTVTGRAATAVAQAEVLADRLSGRDETRTYLGVGSVVVGAAEAVPAIAA